MNNTQKTHSSVLNGYWENIPVGKENAITYAKLCKLWQCTERAARGILHELSSYDNGDDYILIRSSSCKGFYKTDNPDEMQAYKRECLNKGRSIFAPVRKINRVLNANVEQYSFENSLRVVREGAGLTQCQVCSKMQKYINGFDKSLLSKIENSVILPTPQQIILLSQIYGVEPLNLVNVEFILPCE